MSRLTIHVHANADGKFPELTRRDQIRGLMTGLGGVRRLNGPPAVLIVGRTTYGRPIALEANLATLVVAVQDLARAHGIDFDMTPAPKVEPPCPGCRHGFELDAKRWHIIPEGVRTIPFACTTERAT